MDEYIIISFSEKSPDLFATVSFCYKDRMVDYNIYTHPVYNLMPSLVHAGFNMYDVHCEMSNVKTS